MATSPSKPWTGAELKVAEKLWKEGLRIEDMAKQLDRSRESVNHQIKRDRERFPRRQQAWGTLRKPTSVRVEVSEFLMREIKKEAKERGISINVLLRETLLNRFVRKTWKLPERTSTEKVKYSNGSQEF